MEETNRTEAVPKKVVMVTGGTGLVGVGVKEFVSKDAEAKEQEEYFFLSSKDGDLRSMDDAKAIFEKYKPTHVIHLAAKVGGLFGNLNHKVRYFRDNILINDCVMECCRIYKVEKMVSCLSTCMYPDKVTYPIDETMIHDGPPHPLLEGFAYAKRMIDILNHSYRHDYGCNFTSVIPTNVYGKGDNFSIDDGHAIPGLIHKCYQAKQAGGDLHVWGTGSPLRQFIYNADVGALMVWAMRHHDDVEPIILSVPEADEVSIADVAKMIASAMDFKGNLVFDTEKPDGQFKKTASNAQFTKKLPDFKYTPLKDGVQQACDWFCENFETARK